MYIYIYIYLYYVPSFIPRPRYLRRLPGRCTLIRPPPSVPALSLSLSLSLSLLHPSPLRPSALFVLFAKSRGHRGCSLSRRRKRSAPAAGTGDAVTRAPRLRRHRPARVAPPYTRTPRDALSNLGCNLGCLSNLGCNLRCPSNPGSAVGCDADSHCGMTSSQFRAVSGHSESNGSISGGSG